MAKDASHVPWVEKDTLGKGLACLSCRYRKLKCDASRPVCSTCLRSYNHLLRRLKPGQEPPTYPVCVFKSGDDAASHPPPPPHPSEAREPKSRTQQEYPKDLVELDGIGSASAGARVSPEAGPSSRRRFNDPSEESDLNYQPQPQPQQPPSFPLPSYISSNPPRPFQTQNIPPFSFDLTAANLQPPSWLSLPPSSSSSPSSHPPTFDDFVHDPRSRPRNSSFPHPSQDTYQHPSGPPPSAQDLSEELRLPEEESSSARLPSKAEGEEFGTELLQLLWPGWPPHLPSPGKLEMIVEVFFEKVPFSTELLNRGRFLSALALPPRHRLFPHPALLHAICAATSRYLDGIVLLPPSSVPRPYTPRSNDLDEQRFPVWDGFGPTPPNTTLEVDSDFGEIHHFWASLYIERNKLNAELWFSIVQALVLLSNYSHQHARWIPDWCHLALCGRLIVPLGLNSRNAHYNGVTSRSIPRDSVLRPPEDDVERIERMNLLWIVFANDTYHCTVAAWQGALDIQDLYLGLPTSRSTFPPGFVPPYPTQFASDDDEDLFAFSAPVHSSSFALQIKATVLLRKVSDYIRRADKLEIEDPRKTAGFRRLDRLIDSFKSSLASNYSNPGYLALDGSGFDGALVMAHALVPVSIINLHDRYFDLLDASDPSGPRLLEAARTLLSQVYLLISTGYPLALLHPFMTHAWLLPAKVLTKYLQIAVMNGDSASESIFASEIQVFKNAMAKVGEKFPIGVNSQYGLDFSTNPPASDIYVNPLCFPPPATVSSWLDDTPNSTPPFGGLSSSSSLLNDALMDGFPPSDWWAAST